MELSAADRSILERLEEELWREESRFDLARMREVIAADFFEFGMSGRLHRRDEILAVPRQHIGAEFPLPGFAAKLLAADVASVTYNCARRHGGGVSHTRRSSIWTRSSGGWILRFHQATPYEKNA